MNGMPIPSARRRRGLRGHHIAGQEDSKFNGHPNFSGREMISAALTTARARLRGGSGEDEQDAVLRSIRRRIAELSLDLSDMVVVTEAATGAYSVTATIAAMAGARRVYAIGRDTQRHGSFEDAAEATLSLAERAGVQDRITVSRQLAAEMLERCDILTNCGHLRPLSRAVIARLPRDAVIALMYEGWEFRGDDIDLAACRQFGVRVAAVNERHPAVGVFAFLGPLCVRLLRMAGLDPPGKRIALICNNPFAPFLHAGLVQAGASVILVAQVGAIPAENWDAVVLAVDPCRTAPLDNSDLARLAIVARGAPLAQFWGDVDRSAAARHGIRIWPRVEAAPGHMGILLSDLGHEPIIRLQGGSLRAAEYVRRGGVMAFGEIAEPLPDDACPDPEDSGRRQ